MKTELKKLIAITGVGVICTIALRVLQIIFMLEADSGFFLKGFEGIGNIITIAIIFIVGVCIIYGICCKEEIAVNIVISKPFAIIHFVMAIAILYESLFSNFTANTQAWKMLLQIIFGLSAALVFAFKGYQAFYSRESSPLLTIVYVLFWLVRLIITFSSYISASVVSENIFEMLAMCAALVFLFNYSALENGASIERRKKAILPSAIAAFCSSAVYAVSQIVVILLGKADMLYNRNATFVTNIVLVFFVFNYTVIQFKQNTTSEEPSEEIEEVSEEII